MKILPNGIAVIEDDTHISKWVEDSGTLRIAERWLRPFHKYVENGGRVIDIGANIGDHTATYADWVGPTGYVFAFEPNPEAFECLQYNLGKTENIFLTNCALSDVAGRSSIVRSPNVGASFLEGISGSIQLRTLDEYRFLHVCFIKIDVEGFETKVLRGAKQTIESSRPVMLIEVNEGALVRAGSSRDELIELIESMKYNWKITENKCNRSSPQYDVICVADGKS